MRDRAILSEGAGQALPAGTTSSGCPLVLTGGPPCQDLSIAGKQAGLDGSRSILWRDYIAAIRTLGPEWVVWENVAHSWRRWLPTVRLELARLGYASLPLRVRASDVGAPHERARIFIVANPDCELLRKLSRWWVGTGRQMADELAEYGEQEPMAYANGEGQLQPEGGKQEVWGRAGHCGWWTVEPDVGRVAHGVPSRVDRLRGLGNAIVPQIAEVIAEGIKAVVKEN